MRLVCNKTVALLRLDLQTGLGRFSDTSGNDLCWWCKYFSFAHLLHLCQCFFVSWHDVMVWPWPCFILRSPNVHLHIIWLGAFVSVSPLPHGTLHLNLVHEKQLLKENGCLHLKGLGTKEVMCKTHLSIRKLMIRVILVNWLSFHCFKIR